MKTLTSFLAFFAFSAFALSDDCRQRVVVRHQQQAAVYQAPVVAAVAHNNYQAYQALVAQYVAVPLLVPTYSVHYGRDDNTKDELKKLQDEIKSLRDALAEPSPKSAPMAPAEPPITVPLQSRKKDQDEAVHDGAKILVASCSKCHDKTNAANKGGGFVLTSGGSIANLTDTNVLAIVREVYSARMPKGGKLNDVEVGTIMEWLDTRK